MSQGELDGLIAGFISGGSDETVDIITFTEAPWGLNFKLTPAQKFIIKMFYAVPLDRGDKNIIVPDDTNEKILFKFNEKEFLNYLYNEGRCNRRTENDVPLRELVLVAGRRGGKSLLSSVISCYELYKLIKSGDPSKLYGFPPNTMVRVTNVAPSDEQGEVVFNVIKSFILNCPYLSGSLLNQTNEYFNLQTEADKLLPTARKMASIMVRCEGCASNSLRGPNNIVVIMDEMGHFIENSGRYSGEEVYKALKPSISAFKQDGKIICISSPYAKYGEFYDLYNRSFDDDTDTILMLKMYSAMMNPDHVDSVLLKSEKRKNKTMFYCEYGAEFSDSVMSWIDEPDLLKSCISDRVPQSRGLPGINYYMGIDLGIKNDGTGICIVHRDEELNKIVVDYAKVHYSGDSDVWESASSIYKSCIKFSDHKIIPISEIVKEIAELSKWFPIKEGWFDQWNGYSLMEQLHDIGMNQFRMDGITDSVNVEVYQLLKMLINDNLIDFYNDPVLISELLFLEAEKKTKRKVIVRAPNKKGAHDDLADALARAVYQVYNAHSEKGVNLSRPGMGRATGRSGNICSGGGDRASKAMYKGVSRNMKGLTQKLTGR